MCRYGGQYKNKFACFDCRKSFRSRPHGAWKQEKDGCKWDGKTPPTCPDCGKPMVNMGLDFKPPKRSDVEQWEKVRRLYENGVTFHSCGCDGPGYRPARLNQVDDFLADRDRRREKSEGERLLERFPKERHTPKER
jgi:hypothetical protein